MGSITMEVTMSIRSIAAMTVLSGALAAGLLAAPLALAQEPTIHQIYQAAEAGKFIEAQKMMDTVLAAHPNSAKAHFVEAELLAKQGKFSRAASELATAERLGPDGKFAKPEALQELKAVLAKARPAAVSSQRAAPSNLAAADYAPSAPAPRSFPWGLMIGIGALIALALVYFKNRAAQRSGGQGFNGGGAQAYGGAPQYPQGGVPPQYGMPGGMAPPAAGGGLGAGIMGGLATGAALGAGMVAGQALAHHFTDGNNSGSGNRGGADSSSGFIDNGFAQNDTPPSGYDMGGGDFGVSDAGSWDSGGGDSGGGGSDWD